MAIDSLDSERTHFFGSLDLTIRIWPVILLALALVCATLGATLVFRIIFKETGLTARPINTMIFTDELVIWICYCYTCLHFMTVTLLGSEATGMFSDNFCRMNMAIAAFGGSVRQDNLIF